MVYADGVIAAEASHLEGSQPVGEAPAGVPRRARDLRIDFLRGAVILAMVVDHVGGDSSWLYAVTGGDRFYVSAAEGFVFLAGVVAGMVYGPRAARKGGAAAARLLRRAGIIYLWTMSLTLVSPFVARALQLGWEDPLRGYTPLQFVVGVLTLHRTYHLTDVLLLYVLLFSVAGLVIVWMVDGHTKAVLIWSWAAWGLWQTATDYPAPWDIQAMNVFQFAAWQALFVTGLAIGIHRDALAARFTRRSAQLCLLLGGLGLTGSIVSFHVRAINRTLGASAATHLVSKADLGIGRLFVFACLAVFAIGLVALAWQPLSAALGWLLLPLGQNSLTAYILHIGVVMLIAKLGLIAFGGGPTAAQNSLVQLTGVLALWALIQVWSRRETLLRIRKRATLAYPLAGAS
jgi:hypothetical protein